MNENQKRVEARVIAAAEAAIAARKVVAAIDVLQGIGWLEQSSLDAWRRGQNPYLERSISANLHKISDAMHFFRSWAIRRGLKPSEPIYLARTRDRRRLRFSKGGDEAIEHAYSTHWVSPELSEAKRQRLKDRESRPPDLVVIQPLKDWTCRGSPRNRPLLKIRMPGSVAAAIREGANLERDRAVGRRTWEEFPATSVLKP